MRNLKRVLSLALALVMIIGMMVVGAGAASADFGDGAKIKNVEAVDVLTGLGVLEGDEKDNFNPTDILTREQAAKMITYMVLGTKNAEAVSKNKVVVFNDVAAERWSAGFIAWCYNQGILAGNGDGSFAPTEPLTGVAYAKMLLTALGYDAAVEGYVNNINWATNIGADAIAAGLDLKGELLASPLTRDNAAQMTLQALEADVVKYEDKGIEVVTADGTVIRAGVVGPFAVEGEKKADYNAMNDKTDDTLQLVEKLYEDVVKTDKVDDDVWGNPAEFGWYNGKKELHVEWATPVAEYFTAVYDCDIVDELDADKGDEIAVYEDGNPEDDYKLTDKDVYVDSTGTGVWTRLYEDRIVCINTYFAVVTDTEKAEADRNGHIGKDTVELTIYTKVKGEVVAVEDVVATVKDADEYEKDQYVLVNMLAEDNDVQEIFVPETDTLKVTRVKYADYPVMDTVTADGTKYGENVKYCATEPLTRNNEYDLYFDLYGNIIFAEEPDAAKDVYEYGIITAIKWVDENDELEDGYAKANVLKMDGDADSMKGVELVYSYVADTKLAYAWDNTEAPNYDDATVATTTQANKAGWTDILTKFLVDDETYDIKAAGEESDITTIIAGDKNVVADGEGYARTNSKTVYLVKTMEKNKPVYTSYTGFKNVPSMDGVKNVQYFTAKNYVSYMFVDATEAVFLGETDLAYVISSDVVAKELGLEIFEGFIGTDLTEFATEKVADLGITSGLYEVDYNAEGEVIGMTEVGYYMAAQDEDGFTVDGDVLEDWVDGKDVADMDISDTAFYEFKRGKVVAADAKDADGAAEIWVYETKGGVAAIYILG